LSGSDDSLCKVWDRRCKNTPMKPVGVLVGHLDGIAFLSSKVQFPHECVPKILNREMGDILSQIPKINP
jgi:hypothetical protein